MKPHATLAAVLVIAAARAVAAQPASAPVVWYRSSQRCPDGAHFLALLERRGVQGRLAGVGDRVDFVVTLGESDHGPSGRLERQTDAGTVAIRELDAESCDDVADGLALSLSLTFQPKEPSPEAPTSPSVVAPPPAAPHRDEAAPQPSRATTREVAWALGAQGTASIGIAPGVMPGLAVFVERDALGPGVVSPSFRLSVAGSQSSSDTSRGELSVRLGTLRLEGCPLLLGAATLSLRPCLGAGGGVVGAEGSGATGLSDARPWFDIAAHGRLRWMPVRRFSLEAQAGGTVPLVRYSIEFAQPHELIHRSAPVAFQAGLGAAFRWQ